jgi:AhpD family alkylhydroperoxidase
VSASRPPAVAAVIAQVLQHHPDVIAELTAAHDAAWNAVDPVLLELCRLRVAMLLGCATELAVRTPAALAAGLDERTVAELASWPTSSRFDPRARACLAFTEQFVIDVASLDHDLTDAVTSHLGSAGLVDLAHALLVVEQRQRLALAWRQLLDPVVTAS